MIMNINIQIFRTFKLLKSQTILINKKVIYDLPIKILL